MKKIITIVALALSSLSFSQDKALYLSFPPLVSGTDYTMNSVVQDLSGRYMQIQDFNYYLSNIHIIHDGGQDLDLSDTILLVKGDAHEFDMGAHDITNIEQINFGVGVPQELNHLDITQYPTGHFLSFQTPSMHWGWTSGYKLLLCDGKGDNNTDGTPETLFQIHNVGDANYKNVQLPVVGVVGATQVNLIVDCNIDEWIYGANPATVGVLHGTTGLNASTMNNVNSRSVFSQSASASLNEMTEHGELYFVNQTDHLKLNWKDLTGINHYTLVDMAGRVIESNTTDKVNGSHSINNLNSGQYIFTVYDDNNRVINSINVSR